MPLCAKCFARRLCFGDCRRHQDFEACGVTGEKGRTSIAHVTAVNRFAFFFLYSGRPLRFHSAVDRFDYINRFVFDFFVLKRSICLIEFCSFEF